MKPTTLIAVLLSGMAAVLSANLGAATYCVGDGPALQTALNSASASPEADVIRLRSGTFTASSSGGFRGDLDGGSLELSGGWSAGCLFRQRGARSTIDGAFQRPGMLLVGQNLPTPRGVRVAHATFRRGVGPEFGGLMVVGTGVGRLSVEIEDSRFIDNHQSLHEDVLGAGLMVSAGNIRVFGNVFTDNDAANDGGAAYLSCNGGVAAFSNNTVIGNTAGFGQPGKTGGVRLWGCQWEVANNILWDNESYDLNIGGVAAVVNHNNIGALNGTPISGGNNLALDPRFVSASNLRLRRDSPLIDVGFSATFLGLPQFSHDGGPRIAGPAIDLGAYELDVLFTDDFDPLILIPSP